MSQDDQWERERDRLALERITGYLHEEIPLDREFKAGYDAGYERGLADRPAFKCVQCGDELYTLKTVQQIEDLTAELAHLTAKLAAERDQFGKRETELMAALGEMLEALKDIVRNSHDIIAKKRCSEVLANLPKEMK